MFWDRDVSVNPSTGQVHVVRLEHAGARLQFDDDSWLTLPWACVAVRLAVSASGDRLAVVTRHDTGEAYRVQPDGRHELVGPTGGVGHVDVQYRSGQFRVYRQVEGGVLETGRDALWPVPYASTGIHHIADDGAPIMGTDPSLVRVVAGVQLWSAVTRQGWTCGVGEVGRDGGTILIAPDGRQTMRVGYTPFPPRLCVAQGHAYVAISGFHSPDPRGTPTWEAYDAMPPVAPDLGTRALWLDDMSGNMVGGTCGPAGFHQRIVEDARYVLPQDEPRLLALWYSPHEPGADAALTRAIAQRVGCPVILYDDGHATVPPLAGVTQMRGIQAYPRPGETPDTFEARIARAVLSSPDPCVLVAAGYHVHGITDEPLLARCLLALERVIRACPQVVMLCLFGLDRPPLMEWPRRWWQAVLARGSAMGPALPQTPIAPPPVVVPPEPAPVVSPPSTRPADVSPARGKLYTWLRWILRRF